MRRIRVLIADDHPLFREGVARSLAADPWIEICGEAENADEVRRLAAERRPDVALLDISMPGGGLSALRDLIAMSPAPRCAMLTVSEDEEDVVRALRTGALGYVLKGVGARELIEAVKDLADGRSFVSPSLAIKLHNAAQSTAAHPLDDLTRREEEILRLVAEGMSNKEIGRSLELQEKTIKHYMTVILQKLQARNRVEAALIARERWPAR